MPTCSCRARIPATLTYSKLHATGLPCLEVYRFRHPLQSNQNAHFTIEYSRFPPPLIVHAAQSYCVTCCTLSQRSLTKQTRGTENAVHKNTPSTYASATFTRSNSSNPLHLMPHEDRAQLQEIQQSIQPLALQQARLVSSITYNRAPHTIHNMHKGSVEGFAVRVS